MIEDSVMRFKNTLTFGLYLYFIPSNSSVSLSAFPSFDHVGLYEISALVLILSLIRPQWTRGIGLTVQGFALLGTLVGIFTIVVGIGPGQFPISLTTFL